jgi:hypothetical protein
MIIVGYKNRANFSEAARVIKKHTNLDAVAVKNMIEQIKNGNGVSLPNDFCLREDLEDLHFLIS